MPETYFCAFISSCGKCLKIKSEWEKDEFKLIILQDCDSWECKVTAADITRELPGINANSYIELSKEILARKNKGKLCDYSVDENIFSWQKRSEDGEAIFSGFANLKKIPYNESIIKFVDSFLSLNSELTEEMTILEQESKTLEAETRKLISCAQQEIDKKKTMETELLSKFYLLLQEKKNMVSLLENLAT
ncbi:unnamed protein product [Bemisia tabaci]|uniref:XRCC4 N-terminal domain-containing protein n=1 Tax=Bemisia tabaci TaxID=7038 RepID=A0A9P0A6A5_BEMTA|nr:unnamed protein product [Bemisia tabaci]